MASVKKQVQAAFFDAGLALEREALSTFVAFIEENGGEEELIYTLLDSIVQGGKPSCCALSHRCMSHTRHQS